MVCIGKKMYERNNVETIGDSDQLLWLNEKHIQKELDHKNLRVTMKYHSDHRKYK